jgi:transcriptional regulator with XRE-family HTH domain
MTVDTDFSWAEVGARIHDRRRELGLSQQQLADAAEITQGGYFRIEAGETNPQLSSLQKIAAALDCTVRDLVAGMSDAEQVLTERYRRLRRVVESGDDVAIRAVDCTLECAEALCKAGRERTAASKRNAGSDTGNESIGKFIDAFGVDSREQGWMPPSLDRRARTAFRNKGTKNETKTRNK